MKLDIDFFKIEHNNVLPGQGRVLISEPSFQDKYFGRSVVLLTEHNKDGSIGFILNKPVALKINEVLKDFPEFDAKVSLGGPVNPDTIHYLHTLGKAIPNSVKVLDDLYWGGDFDELKFLIKSGAVKNNQVRFFVGYSGWNPNQLKKEISSNYWLVAETSSENIMSTHSKSTNIWEETLKQLGEKYKMWTNFPENPGMN